MLPHNVWSCGDVSNNLTGFTITSYLGDAEISQNHPTNGVNGIKCKRTNFSVAYGFTIVHSLNIAEYRGKTLKFSADILNTNSTPIAIQCKVNGTNVQSTSIPPSDKITSYEITYNILDTAETFECILLIGSTDGDKDVYFDNWCLEEIIS